MKNKIFFTIFMFIWLTLIILNFIVKSEAFSEQENRYLAQMPSFSAEKLLDGEFQTEVDNYSNDHFIFRNICIKIKSGTERLLR